jgi:hypothetical protein
MQVQTDGTTRAQIPTPSASKQPGVSLPNPRSDRTTWSQRLLLPDELESIGALHL